MDGYAGGDNYLWRIGACVRDEKIAGCHSRPPKSQKDPAPRYRDLQVSQVTCIRFRLNKCMQTCMLTCAAVIQGVGIASWERSIHGKIYILMDI